MRDTHYYPVFICWLLASFLHLSWAQPPIQPAQAQAVLDLCRLNNPVGWQVATSNWTNCAGYFANPCLGQAGVVCNTATGDVTGLYLSNNQMTGPIPDSFGNLTALVHLQGDTNFLSGTVPASFSNLVALSQVVLYSNLLTGTLPVSISVLTVLQHLVLADNPFCIGCWPWPKSRSFIVCNMSDITFCCSNDAYSQCSASPCVACTSCTPGGESCPTYSTSPAVAISPTLLSSSSPASISSTTSTSGSSNTTGSFTSPATIAGAVAGSVLFVALVATIVLLVVFRKQRRFCFKRDARLPPKAPPKPIET